ncbi:hypothetical protein [Actinoallomurus rhizosphaericola]|uniref:hypothetical protein n=1 Tax=Actinoallomurus rhizosphaericola TaxID=2952536 RepID=UPI0020925167|nr:hypothetical protein [Actinoallomurus rhizosphaericola]MCO5999782.1 hypothetical protein [Actinoallomurus rhizosphaericola]
MTSSPPSKARCSPLADIDRTRIKAAEGPGLTRVVVTIDPAVTSGEDSDETGIVVVGEHDGHGYVLADLSMRGTPGRLHARGRQRV